MIKIIKIEKEVDIKTLLVNADVRYVEDGILNGKQDIKGEMPCMYGSNWCPLIDIQNGLILNWTKGNTAEIHYKVVDEGNYYLRDENGKTVVSKENSYVPGILSPKENGHGDYIIMDIDKNGVIKYFDNNIDDFFEDND